MVSPTLGVALLTVLSTARSASSGVSVALAWLLDALGSTESEWVMVAVLVCGSGLIIVAVIVSVAAPPLGKEPTVHRPDPPVYSPWLVMALTSWRRDGSRSETVAPVAGPGPLLVSVIVYVTWPPTLGLGLDTVLA